MTIEAIAYAYINRPMTDYDKTAICTDAQRAFKLGQTPDEACSHPFATARGQYWLACYCATGLPNVINGVE